jgi:hypothetical protein
MRSRLSEPDGCVWDARGCYTGISDDGNTDGLAITLSSTAGNAALPGGLRRFTRTHRLRTRRELFRIS